MEENSDALSVLDAATHLRRACLLPLGAVDVRESISLDELQALVHTLLNLQGAYLKDELEDWAGSVEKDNFLLRELRADLLPGRSYWTSEALGPVSTSTNSDTKAVAGGKVGVNTTAASAAPSSAGVPSKAGAKQNRSKGMGNKPSEAPAEPSNTINPVPMKAAAAAPVHTPGSVTLKKLGLRGERGLVVELLKDCQARTRPPAGAFRVWVQELLNPGAAEVLFNHSFRIFRLARDIKT